MHKNSQALTETMHQKPSRTTSLSLTALWLCALLWCSLLCVPAQALESQTSWQLGWDIPMDRLDDESGNLEPGAISAIPAERATSRLKAPLNGGYLRHTVWLRFKVPALPPEHEPGDLWLLAQPTYLDYVTLYQKGSDGAWYQQDLVPTDRKPGVRQHLFRLTPGQVALIRIRTSSATQFHADILDTYALATTVASAERLMGLYFGAMAALLVGIWAATVIFRTRALFSLAVLVTASAIHVFNVRGYSSLWSPPDFIFWDSNAVSIGAFLLPAALAWQIKEQLTRNTPYRWTDRFLTFLIAVNVLGAFSGPLGFYPDVAWVNLISLLASDIVGISLCWLALQRRDRLGPHVLLLLAYGLHCVCGVPIAILMTGQIQWNVDATLIWQLEAIVFTALLASAVFVGMVTRYRKAQRAKDQAIERLALSEQSLEERILQRTTELSAAQVALATSLESERALRHEQRQFFHMISHEFRTPLTVIDSAAAEQQSFPSAELQPQVDRAAQIRRSSRRLTALVDSCLINERLDHSGLALQASPVKVSDLLHHAAQLVHWSPRHHLQLFTDSAPLEWVCDATLVHIALSNLVDNAVKYATAGEIFIAAQKGETGLLEISVADEGSGMSLDVMNRIFEQFERGDRTDQSKGFGLGLWVARRIARLHGGDITVQSSEGQGACFTLTLASQRISPSGR